MTEREQSGVISEARRFLDNLQNQADRARQFLVDDPARLRSKKAIVREEKALLLGYSYAQGGMQKAVILKEDGTVFATVSANIYRITDRGYGRFKTKSALEKVHYYSKGEELSSIDVLRWFSTAYDRLLVLVNNE